ncbi:phosphogluconate dehydrogenase (NAD(+)-dependent, decarboxylating) [Ferrovibrio sp. MS7]|uniref:phosphogluconate dehydrogenase (NAD(+)-dependent, decarboxylating) n=1 Tax=Ferrovibrio plantarum TaxID=3119164 RepID=UPI00313640FA
MQIAMVGLGRMGANMVRRLMRTGHDCVVYDRDAAARAALAGEGARAVESLSDLVQALKPPRAIWLMLPEGAITQQNVDALAALMAPGDMLIDGGNSFWKDDIRRATALREKGLVYLDVGTSGGVWGLERGYCLMIGGPDAAVRHLDPIFAALAPGRGEIPLTPGREGRDARVEQGYLHAGGNGAGHYVKMIHNAIEYGMMQAMAEGFDIMRHAGDGHVAEELRLDLEVADIAEVWRRGSVVTSWLLDLTATALAKDGDLAAYSGQVNDSGEGRWALQAAVEQAVPAEVLSAALFARFRSRRQEKFAEKVLSAMRAGFGGHTESK